WDPENRMNPGKVVHAFTPTENLRYGVTYEPKRPETFFRFPDDQFSIAYAMERCVGVGECRRHAGGVMCPSYQATREEKHSTRGRARLLWEMLHGDVVTKGWRDEAVKESLDLCLACKGCKGDCPVNVDMATYKAEFYAHYYARRRRPMPAYTMGLIYWWARLASHVPRLANAATHTPVLSRAVKLAGGLAPEREIPRFARRTFRAWFRKRPVSASGGRRVILWPDTFSNYLLPGRAKAAVEVLEAAGYRVEIPSRPLCCGRPLYDWGMLSQAKGLWKQVLDELRPAIREGVPVVGLEPSCVSAFRDELANLFPHDQDAQRLAIQTFTLNELLINDTKDYQPPKVGQKAIVHAHCHHRAVLKFDAEMELMRRMGLDTEMPETSCCGMAGSFGFERGEKYEVAMQCGERALLPAVRRAPEDRLVIADGFSCQEQIAQGTGRRAQHISEVLAEALRRQQAEPGARPEETPGEREHHMFRGIAVSGAAVALIGTVAVRAQHRGERRRRTDGRRERRRMRLRR
ncbi:MAG: (Fe-S)-binding protein, partial [Hyphomicrobiales bacterium]